MRACVHSPTEPFDRTVRLEPWDEHLAGMLSALNPERFKQAVARAEHLMIMKRYRLEVVDK